MFSSAGANPLALHTDNQKSHRTIDPYALKIPPRRGGLYTNGERRFSISG
jgi:hypothetical protein